MAGINTFNKIVGESKSSPPAWIRDNCQIFCMFFYYQPVTLALVIYGWKIVYKNSPFWPIIYENQNGSVLTIVRPTGKKPTKIG